MPHSKKPRSDPEYIAIILAATQGARLFPLTSEFPQGVPKHLLPLCPLNNVGEGSKGDAGSSSTSGSSGGGGAPLLQRLLLKTYESSFEMVVVAIHKEDTMTIPFLLGKGVKNNEDGQGLCKVLSKEHASSISSCATSSSAVTDLEFCGDILSDTSGKLKNSKASTSQRSMHVRIVRLPEECHGSADALRFLSRGNDSTSSSEKDEANGESTDNTNDEESSCLIPRTSHAVVMPGDLILEAGLLSNKNENGNDASVKPNDGQDVLSLLVQSHRHWNAFGASSPTSSAVTMLLTDVGAEDKEGVPLKESSKAKMGLLSREEEDMEYMGLSSEVPPPLSGSLASISYSKGSGDDAAFAPSRRVVLKRSKIEVEEDEGTGSTPKLTVAKRRLHASGGVKHGKNSNSTNNSLAQLLGGLSMATNSTASIDPSPSLSLRTDLHDVHLYVISNWVFQLLHARPSMASFQKEVLPLLISRQFRGVEAAFGPTSWKVEANRERLRNVLRELDGCVSEVGGVASFNGYNKVSTLLGMYSSAKSSGGLGGFFTTDNADGDRPSDELDATAPKSVLSSLPTPPSFPDSAHPFVVSAQVLSREASSLTLRACTLPTLLYGCSEITSRTLKLDPKVSTPLVPKSTQLSTKFNSILLPGCSVGEKVTTKSCTIGKNVVLGDKAKLNNVVVMDGAVIGENTVMQNSVVGVGANIGDNCNLKDCQVGPAAVVASGTRTTEKGEAFHV
jgi:hypothetical protein